MYRLRKLVAAIAIAVGASHGSQAIAGDQDRLSDLLLMIRLLEAPRGYDDYYRGVAASPPQALTSMSICEVLAWQDAIDPQSRSEAAGGYMIMEDTLRALHVEAGISCEAMFNRATQDRLGEHLARDAGWGSFKRGEISAQQFGDQLASVWAALPLLSGTSRGRSRYHGLAGNKALISADRFEHVLNNLGAIDVGATVGGGVIKTAQHKVLQKPQSGFVPSKVVQWTSDPFYQE